MISASSLSSLSPTASSSTPPTRGVYSSTKLDPKRRSSYLVQLLDIDVSQPVIDYIVDYVSHVVGQSDVDQPITLYPMTRGRSRSRGHPRPAKMSHHSDTTSFVKRVLCKARVKMSEVLATLAYIDRAQPYLEISSDSKYLFERVFLGALIVATKFLNDSSLPNIHWAQCTRLFGKHDVCRIEREFLEVLDWELRLTEDDLLAHYDSLILVAFPKAPLSSVHRPFKLPASEECTHVEEREENMLHSSSLLSFPSSAHQRSNTNSPTRLPLTSYLFSPSSCLPTSVSPSTPDLEFDDTQLALDTDSDPSCSPPLLTPPSGLTLESDGNRCSGGRKNSDSFWDTFFSSMRIQEASSPILRFQERRQSSICH